VELIAATDVPAFAERPRVDRSRGCLIGSRCDACSATSWPARAVCHRCGRAKPATVELSRVGTLLTYTTVAIGRPGVPAPYVLGQVRLDDGPVVFGHVRDLDDGAAVPLAVRIVIGADELATPWYWFSAASHEEDDHDE